MTTLLLLLRDYIIVVDPSHDLLILGAVVAVGSAGVHHLAYQNNVAYRTGGDSHGAKVYKGSLVVDADANDTLLHTPNHHKGLTLGNVAKKL